MKVGCYTLDLYCSREGCTKPMPHQFTGQTEAECIRKARRRGWVVAKTKELCPACSGKKLQAEEVPAALKGAKHTSVSQLEEGDYDSV